MNKMKFKLTARSFLEKKEQQFRTIMLLLLLLHMQYGLCAQMSIPGQFSVNQTGAATYTMPILVPPGVAGMEPKLALVYNSQSSSGLLGKGWHLSGLSSITRCTQTIGQDPVVTATNISYTSSDRFCLDGQRLINVPQPISSGVYTGAGA